MEEREGVGEVETGREIVWWRGEIGGEGGEVERRRELVEREREKRGFGKRKKSRKGK